jgi:intein/homing endonuclease
MTHNTIARPEDIIILTIRKRIVLLHLGGNVIRTVSDHPLYTTKGWLDAGNLRVGDLLRTLDSEPVPVEAVSVSDEQ